MDETCGAAYLHLLALPPLRLLTGLRWADGACVPRWLLPPSPRHPGSENDQWLSTSNSFSSSHACTSDGFPFPHVLIPVGSVEPAALGVSSCRDPSSASASTSLSRCLAAVSTLLSLSYPLFASPTRDTAGGRKPSIGAGFSPGRTGSRSAAGPSRCSAR